MPENIECLYILRVRAGVCSVGNLQNTRKRTFWCQEYAKPPLDRANGRFGIGNLLSNAQQDVLGLGILVERARGRFKLRNPCKTRKRTFWAKESL